MSEEADDPLKIFSYGSNMSSRRLAARVPSARFVGVGSVVGYTLRFHKKGRLDSSGKANMLRTGSEEDRVWGVVREIDRAHKPELDRVEGLGAGYEEEWVQVRMKDRPGASLPGPRAAGSKAADEGSTSEVVGSVSAETVRFGNVVRARAYVADPAYIDDRLLPYGWYLDFVLDGAREHELPESYVARVESEDSARDPDEERRLRNRKLLAGTDP